MFLCLVRFVGCRLLPLMRGGCGCFDIDVRSRYFISLVFLFLYRSFVAWGGPFSIFKCRLVFQVSNSSSWSFQFNLLLYSYIHTYYRHQGFVARMQKVMFEKIQRTLRAVALVDQFYHHRRVMLLNKWWQWDLQKVKIQRSLRAVALVSRSKLSSSPSHAVSYLWTSVGNEI